MQSKKRKVTTLFIERMKRVVVGQSDQHWN